MNQNEIIGYALVFICLLLAGLLGEKIVFYNPKSKTNDK